MKTPAFFTLLFLLPGAATGQKHIPVFPNLTGQTLLDSLEIAFSPSAVLDYDDARDYLYSTVYLEPGDSVRCIYSGHSLHVPQGVDPSAWLSMNNSANGINCEHIYPRSKGADAGFPLSDMHHLYPTRAAVNTARDNFPFADIEDAKTETWYFRTGQQATPPPPTIRDFFSERVNGLFEPPERQKGNIARAVFYFYSIYSKEADDADPVFFEKQRRALCNWHYADAVDSLEFARTFLIAEVQGRPNPFVLDCSLPTRCYCSDDPGDCPDLPVSIFERSPEIEFSVSPNPSSGAARARGCTSSRRAGRRFGGPLSFAREYGATTYIRAVWQKNRSRSTTQKRPPATRPRPGKNLPPCCGLTCAKNWKTWRKTNASPLQTC